MAYTDSDIRSMSKDFSRDLIAFFQILESDVVKRIKPNKTEAELVSEIYNLFEAGINGTSTV